MGAAAVRVAGWQEGANAHLSHAQPLRPCPQKDPAHGMGCMVGSGALELGFLPLLRLLITQTGDSSPSLLTSSVVFDVPDVPRVQALWVRLAHSCTAIPLLAFEGCTGGSFYTACGAT